MAEEPSLSYYLPIAGGRIIGFIPFPRVLVLCEMQSVSSRIWTRIAMFISYGDNDYTTGTSGNNGITVLQLMLINLCNTLLFDLSVPFFFLSVLATSSVNTIYHFKKSKKN